MKQSANRLNISEKELLEYINSVAPVVPVRPKGFGITSREYSIASRVDQSTAKRILDKLAKTGNLKVQTMKYKGHILSVFYK
jgi:hypothetical protein